MPSAGTLIWIACRPLLRLIFCVAGGIIVTKADIFPPVAAQGTAQILLNVLYPCLMFSKIVPAFTSDNLKALGPLVLVALLYQIMGALLAWIVKQFFWVPHRFRYGIIVSGAFHNVGDIPTAVVLSLAASAPFGGPNDQNLSVAYVSMFVLVFVATLFPLGSHRLISWDYVGPDVESEDLKAAMKQKRKRIFSYIRNFGHPRQRTRDEEKDDEASGAVVEEYSEKKETEEVSVQPVLTHRHGRHVAFVDDTTTVAHTEAPSPPPTEISVAARARRESTDRWAGTTVTGAEDQISSKQQSQEHTTGLQLDEAEDTETKLTSSRSRFRFTRQSALEFFKSFFSPPSISIFVSFPIALIPPLKALFVHVEGVNMPNAPDGQPPLAVLMDIATFVGAGSVPLGLICLGSSLARLPFPKKGEWRTLPLGAISSLAIGKMLVMPVIGVVICEGLTSAGVIQREDKVLRLVCIICSCLPTATTQVFLTQVYSGTGTAEHLSAFLIPQYLIMFISLTTLIAYTLQLLF